MTHRHLPAMPQGRRSHGRSTRLAAGAAWSTAQGSRRRRTRISARAWARGGASHNRSQPRNGLGLERNTTRMDVVVVGGDHPWQRDETTHPGKKGEKGREEKGGKKKGGKGSTACSFWDCRASIYEWYSYSVRPCSLEGGFDGDAEDGEQRRRWTAMMRDGDERRRRRR